MKFSETYLGTSLAVRLFEPSLIYAMGIKCFLKSHFKNTKLVITCNPSLANDKKSIFAELYDLVLFNVPADLEEVALCKKLSTIKKLFPKAKIILHSMEYNTQILDATFNKKFQGYFLLSDDPEKISKVINDVLNGDVAISEKVLLSYLSEKAMLDCTLVESLENKMNKSLAEYESKAFELLSNNSLNCSFNSNVKPNKKNWEYFIKSLVNKARQTNHLNCIV